MDFIKTNTLTDVSSVPLIAFLVQMEWFVSLVIKENFYKTESARSASCLAKHALIALILVSAVPKMSNLIPSADSAIDFVSTKTPTAIRVIISQVNA